MSEPIKKCYFFFLLLVLNVVVSFTPSMFLGFQFDLVLVWMFCRKPYLGKGAKGDPAGPCGLVS